MGWRALNGCIVGYPLNVITTRAPAVPIEISHPILLFRRPVNPLAVHEAGPGEAERGVQEENNHRNFSRRPAGEILLKELPCRSGKMRSSMSLQICIVHALSSCAKNLPVILSINAFPRIPQNIPLFSWKKCSIGQPIHSSEI